jgi:hypothetical protein
MNLAFYCVPYSRDTLHEMADYLGIGRHWFHKNHYDIPVKRKEQIMDMCVIISSKDIVRIIMGQIAGH